MDFVYPTSATSDELRLLEPVSITQDALHFNLTIFPREATPVYTAVSYTWGNLKASQVIYLNNRRFQVRPNLWLCLYYLGQDAQRLGIMLWVDAICIDQSDYPERNAQVGRMDNTYRAAEYVSVWLGLPSISGQPPVSVKDIEAEPLDWSDHLDDLANRPYWSRMWVIQECLLAKTIFLFCGNSSIHWDGFQSLLHDRTGMLLFEEFDV